MDFDNFLMSSDSLINSTNSPLISQIHSLYQDNTTIGHNKDFESRGEIENFVNQGILDNQNLSNSGSVRQIEWAKTTDFLKRKIEHRPNKEDLIEKRILKTDKFGTSPYVMEKCHTLEKQHLQETLNTKLSQRPGSLELVERGVLSVEPGIDNLIRDGSIKYPRVVSQQNNNRQETPALKPPKPPPLPPISEKQLPNGSGSGQKPNFHKEIVKMNGFVFHHYRPQESSKTFKEKQEARVAQQAELLKLSAAAENKRRLERELIKYKSDPSYKNSITELNHLSLATIKHECNIRSLPTNGNKSSLISLLAPYAESVIRKHTKLSNSIIAPQKTSSKSTEKKRINSNPQNPILISLQEQTLQEDQHTVNNNQLGYLNLQSQNVILMNSDTTFPFVTNITDSSLSQSLNQINALSANQQPFSPSQNHQIVIPTQFTQSARKNFDSQPPQSSLINQSQQQQENLSKPNQTFYILQNSNSNPALAQINQNIPTSNVFYQNLYQIIPQRTTSIAFGQNSQVYQKIHSQKPCQLPPIQQQQRPERSENLSESLSQIEKIWMKIRQTNENINLQLINNTDVNSRNENISILSNDLQRLTSLCRLLITDRLDKIRNHGNDPLNNIEEEVLMSHLEKLTSSASCSNSVMKLTSLDMNPPNQLRRNAFVDSSYGTMLKDNVYSYPQQTISQPINPSPQVNGLQQQVFLISSTQKYTQSPSNEGQLELSKSSSYISCDDNMNNKSNDFSPYDKSMQEDNLQTSHDSSPQSQGVEDHYDLFNDIFFSNSPANANPSNHFNEQQAAFLHQQNTNQDKSQMSNNQPRAAGFIQTNSQQYQHHPIHEFNLDTIPQVDSFINTPSLFSEHFDENLTLNVIPTGGNPAAFHNSKNWHEFEIMDTTQLKPSII